MPESVTTRTGFDRWVLGPALRRQAPVTLICVPFAGGGTAAYHGWAELLPPFVRPWMLRLPGRESRLREQPHHDLLTLAETAADALAPRLDTPFALYGHSLGALVAFEIARALRRRHGLTPGHLAVGARPAPAGRPAALAVNGLSDLELLDLVDGHYRTIAPEIRTDPELRALVVPALRADMTMLETYDYRPGDPLACSMSAFSGRGDTNVSVERMRGWAAEVTGDFRIEEIPGGHFFQQEQKQLLVDLLCADLRRLNE